MIHRVLLFLVGTGLFAFATEGRAQGLRVVETGPADKSTIETLTNDFFVRFDKPIDHLRSTFVVMRGNETVQTLHPRFKTEPNVLFAQAPQLGPGDYRLKWSVPDFNGTETIEGEISFTIKSR